MIWPVSWSWRPLTKRERKLANAKAQERARERQAANEERRRREADKKRASWDRMKADIARRYAVRSGDDG
jgi:hypothetical protein